MATLMDTIAKQQEQAPAQVQEATLSAPTLNVQQVSQAATGKAGPGTGGIAASQQQVLAQKQAAQVTQQQQQTAGQQQAVQLRQQQQAQQQQMTQQQARLKEKQTQMKETAQRQSLAIMNELQQGRAQLGQEQYASRIQQVTQGIRLANDKYLTSLENKARLASLEDDIRFQEEMQKTVWADEQELLNSNMDFQNLLRADQRTFEKLLASIDLNTAISIAQSQQQAAGAQQMWSGIGAATSAGVSAWEKSGKKEG